MKLEEKIAFLRKKNGWSQEELAFRLDVSRQAVSKWEMGASLPDLDNVLKMSELFSCSTDYLLKEGEISKEKTVETNLEEKTQNEKPKKTLWKYVEDLFWLLIYKDPKTKGEFENVNFNKYFDGLMRRINGLNELLFNPTEIVTIMSLLEAALIETRKEDFDYLAYRKLVLDAHAQIDKIGG